jgi:NSS family neurotransmitter:Na+ symporter
MADQNAQETPHWSSGAAFFFVAAGLAIGLGNIWRFPFLVGQYGGGAFVLLYLGAVFVFGLPIIIAELVIGRRGGAGPAESIHRLSVETKASPLWGVIGWLCVFIPFIGIAYYSVVAGWVVDYTFDFIAKGGLPGGTAAVHQARFDDMLASPLRVVVGHSVFMLLVVVVVGRGVNEGLEKAAKYLMPALFVLMIGLAAYASATGDIARTVEFLFRPDFSKLTAEAVAAACGQAFFSLGVGLGAMMMFGAYLPSNVSILRVSSAVAIADTSIALIAGLAIFPITFAHGVDPAAGPGLIFVSMPAAFADMPAGYAVGSFFFILLFIAAFTTGVATIEPVVAWLQGFGMKRVIASVVAGASAWFVGLAAAFSFNIWSDVRPLSFIPSLAEKSIFDTLDFLIAIVLLPLNALLISLFAGWALSTSLTQPALATSPAIHAVWRCILRFIAPPLIVLALWAGA